MPMKVRPGHDALKPPLNRLQSKRIISCQRAARNSRINAHSRHELPVCVGDARVEADGGTDLATCKVAARRAENDVRRVEAYVGARSEEVVVRRALYVRRCRFSSWGGDGVEGEEKRREESVLHAVQSDEPERVSSGRIRGHRGLVI